MVKQKLHRDNYDRVLFKNSKHSFNTQSRNFSSASKLCSESVITSLKKNISNANYYEYGGKLKRDLSIATDLCILRNYYKNKRSVSIKTPKTVSNNNSDMNSLIDFMENGCGDSVIDFKKSTHLNIDLTTLVMDNLKNLLNCWIRKYLLEKNEAKEKVESVLDSILHGLEVKSKTTSCYSYAVDIKVVDRNDLTDVNGSGKKNAINNVASTISVFSIPLCGSRSKLISTLSIPKHWLAHSINKSKKICNTKVTGTRGKKVDKSIMNVVGVSTETLIKCCANYNENEKYGGNNQWVNLPERDEIHENIRNNVEKQLKTPDFNCRPEFYNSFYGNDSIVRNVNNVHKPKTNKFTCVDSQQFITGFSKQRQSHKNENLRGVTRCKTKKTYKKVKRKKTSPAKCKRVKYDPYACINSKYISLEKQKMFKYFEDIFKCISYFEEISNIKLDISVNICPMPEGQIGEFKKSGGKCMESGYEKDLNEIQEDTAHSITNLNINKSQQLLNFTTHKNNLNPNIITLLDSTLCKEKHSINQGTVTDICEKYDKNFLNVDLINGAQIAREINDLKTIVIKLVDTAKKFLSEHLIATLDYDNENREMHQKMKLNQDDENQISVSEISLPDPKNEQNCKCTQITTSLPKSKVISGIKLKKSPKRSSRIFDPRLLKKSSSYRLFESETILRVTDMTSARNSFGDDITDENSTSTLKKYERTESVVPNRGNLYAFYCDSVQPKYETYIPRQSSKCFCTSIDSSTMKYDNRQKSYRASTYRNKSVRKDTELQNKNQSKSLSAMKKIIIFAIILPLLVLCAVLCIFYIGDFYKFKQTTKNIASLFKTNAFSNQTHRLTLKELGF